MFEVLLKWWMIIQQPVFFILAGVVLFALSFIRTKHKPKIIFLVAFLWFSGIYGIYLSLYIPFWLVSMSISIVSMLLAIRLFRGLTGNVFFWSLIVSLIMVEVNWAIGFWPFSHLTNGAVLVIIYYVLWDIITHYSQNKLTGKIILIDAIFALGSLLILLASTRWAPL